MKREFTCELCHGQFVSNYSEEEAEKEYQESPWYSPNGKAGKVCDDCFQEFQAWFATLRPEQIEAMKNES